MTRNFAAGFGDRRAVNAADPGLSCVQESPVPKHSETILAAIKNSVDLVSLVGEYLTLQRSGSKYKALCPFHDDHNPSLLIDPERQSFKCWSCGAGGDVFDFVKAYERIEFPEALRMLAERAGVALDTPEPRDASASASGGPSKTDLREVVAWAERRVRRRSGGIDRSARLRRAATHLGRKRRPVSARPRSRLARLAASPSAPRPRLPRLARTAPA